MQQSVKELVDSLGRIVVMPSYVYVHVYDAVYTQKLSKQIRLCDVV